MKITSKHLKELIQQVLNDSYKDLETQYPEQLLAEPQEPMETPPEPLQESTVMNKLVRALNQVDPETRRDIFSKFGYFTQAHLLKHLNNVTKASKGDL